MVDDEQQDEIEQTDDGELHDAFDPRSRVRIVSVVVGGPGHRSADGPAVHGQLVADERTRPDGHDDQAAEQCGGQQDGLQQRQLDPVRHVHDHVGQSRVFRVSRQHVTAQVRDGRRVPFVQHPLIARRPAVQVHRIIRIAPPPPDPTARVPAPVQTFPYQHVPFRSSVPCTGVRVTRRGGHLVVVRILVGRFVVARFRYGRGDRFRDVRGAFRFLRHFHSVHERL